ncbi:MAG TPA: DsbE family thiol:disulfide interchange protein [Alphaproteobacteria bacterium]|nr:DsbE family thiol:disulfide interchange protein [Alphaproteobacteria bacterium]
MRRLLFVLPILLFVGLATYFAIPLVDGTDNSVIPSPLIDQPVPTFDLPPLPGREHGLSSADLKGQVQIVNIFASWCIPCRAEEPVLMGLSKTAHVPIRGIDQKDKPEDALKYLAELGDPYTSIGMDSDRHVSIDWGAYGAPETFIVDAEGRIRFKQAAPLTPADVKDTILPLLAKLGTK